MDRYSRVTVGAACHASTGLVVRVFHCLISCGAVPLDPTQDSFARSQWEDHCLPIS